MNLLSNPSKMPCLGFNIPAFKYCPAAQLMAKVKDKAKKFICDACYACKGFYMFNNVKQSLQDKATFVTKSCTKTTGNLLSMRYPSKLLKSTLTQKETKKF